MLPFSIFLLVASLIFSFFAWRKGRPRAWIFPSDALFISCVAFVGIPPLLNLRATTDYSVNYAFDDSVIARALFSIALMFTVFGLVWMFRRVIHVRSILEGASGGKPIAEMLFAITLGLCVLSALLLVAMPEYGEFRGDIIQFLSGQMPEEEYQFSRRFAFNDNILISQIISRLRYSIFAFLFTISACLLLAKSKNYALAAVILVVVFILLPSSISKLPFVFFALYAAIVFLILRTSGSWLRANRVVPTVALSAALLLVALTLLYMIQYPSIFVGVEGFVVAGNLSLYRIFGAVYDSVLQYFTVYPHVNDFAYLTDSSVMALLMDKPPRDISMEVPAYFLGESQWGVTTTPTIFIAGAYASLGYFGVALYSLIVAGYVTWVDGVIVNLRQTYLRVAVYATMMLNVVFFSMVAAPTVFLTYGCGIIPVIALILDGQILRKKRSLVKVANPSRPQSEKPV